jgi:osmotically-inducible protein OsmY
MSIVLLLGFAVLMGLNATCCAAEAVRNLYAASCAAESMGDVMDDTLVTNTVKTELAKDVSPAAPTDIEVSTTQCTVTLAGKLHSSEEKAIVEQKVPGVKALSRQQ